MKGTIHMRVKPTKVGPAIRNAVRLREVNNLDKLFLLRAFLNGLDISTDEARVYLDLIDAGVAVSDHDIKEEPKCTNSSTSTA